MTTNEFPPSLVVRSECAALMERLDEMAASGREVSKITITGDIWRRVCSQADACEAVVVMLPDGGQTFNGHTVEVVEALREDGIAIAYRVEPA